VRWLARPIAIVLLVELGFGVTGAMAGSVLAALAGLRVAARMAGVPMVVGRLTPLPGVWQLAVPVFVLSLSLRVFDKLGLLSVQALGSSLESGFFAAAQNLAIAPGLVAMSLSPLLLAELTRLHVRGDAAQSAALVGASVRLVVGLVPLAAIGAAASHEIMPLVYGSGFAPAAPLAWPLLGAATAMLLVSVTTSVLIACDRAALAAHTVWPWVAPTLVALGLFVPHGGARAAALVTGGAVAASAAASLWAVARATTFPAPWPTLVRSLVISVALGALAAWWPTPGLWVVAKLALLGALTPLLFAASGEFAAHPSGEDRPRPDSHGGAYWDGIASDWTAPGTDDPWRAHADAVNLATCQRWWPTRPVARVLKTDVFDEVAGRGLLPDLETRASATMAIDRSVGAARLARQRRGAAAVGADVRALPFADGAFDVVISNSTLDHFDRVDDIGLALREIRRVLAPGGRLILTLDNPANPAVRLRNALPYDLLNRLGLVPYFVGVTLDADKARALVESLGYRVVGSTAVLHCPRALAIAALRLSRSLRGTAWPHRLTRGLLWFERLERWPTRHRTGYYVALAADVEPR
jgi:SAM-dependent methyltransferase